MRRRTLLFVLLCSVTLAASAQQQPATTSAPPPSHAEAAVRARAAAAALLALYNRHTGLFNTTGWWNSANAITALADESRITGDRAPRSIIGNTFRAAPRKFPTFLNDFYDDEGWWALAWIDAYDLTHEQQYLRTAQSIFTDMTGGWDTTCGGGIWWSKKRDYKNAIANELFLSVAAELASRTHEHARQTYVTWATREWAWFSRTGIFSDNGLVNDGLSIDPATHACRNNGKTTWTYNQGVILGGLSSLSAVSGRTDLLLVAASIAHAAITHLTDANGILHDPCEPRCGADGVQFKGIFTRNLAELQNAAPDPAFANFLQGNADSLWDHARTPRNRFSVVWSGPPAADNAGAQSSALDALNAAASLAP